VKGTVCSKEAIVTDWAKVGVSSAAERQEEEEA
jgi:hypothetical protein